MSWRLAPSTARPASTPAASVSRLRLTPPLPRPFGKLRMGLGPVFSPAQGRFGHGPVHAQPTPVQPFQFIMALQSQPPQFQEHPGGSPFLKAQMGGGTGADAGGVQCFPLAAGAQHAEYAVGACAVRNPGLSAAKAVGIHALGNQGASASQSSPEIRNPPVAGLVLAAGPARLGRGGLVSFALVIAPVQTQYHLAASQRECEFSPVIRIGTKWLWWRHKGHRFWRRLPRPTPIQRGPPVTEAAYSATLLTVAPLLMRPNSPAQVAPVPVVRFTYRLDMVYGPPRH